MMMPGDPFGLDELLPRERPAGRGPAGRTCELEMSRKGRPEWRGGGFVRLD